MGVCLPSSVHLKINDVKDSLRYCCDETSLYGLTNNFVSRPEKVEFGIPIGKDNITWVFCFCFEPR